MTLILKAPILFYVYLSVNVKRHNVDVNLN